MKRALIRSSIFNILFVIISLICCVIFLVGLLLPRQFFLYVVRTYLTIIYGLERFILGLKYVVRGTEHLPKNGQYIVAAKHMSTYETFKLHFLFNDPAIILKKELLKIPLWGLFLKKSDVIAIDRSSPEKSRASIHDGARRMMAQNRPILIFPQGTRVWPHETTKDKPYKRGIYHLQDTTELPIVPMATNSGMFWPRSGWLKSSGTVVFEFLPTISAGKNKADLMKTLEREIENKSNALMLAVKDNQKKSLKHK